MFLRAFAILFVLLLPACTAPDAGEPSGATALRGRIDAAMLARARAALDAGQRRFTIDSHGGELDPALEIGKRIEKAGGTLVVDGACKSACVVALMAVGDRRARPGADIALHRAAGPDGGPSAPLTIGDRVHMLDAAAYGAALYVALGVPADLVARDTAGWNVRRLSPDELLRLGAKP